MRRASTGWAGALLALAAGCFVDGGLVDAGAEATTGAATEPASDLTGETAACGDGVVDPGEACDLGPRNDDAGACTRGCALAACGDGLRATAEGCDDGNLLAGDGCGPDCRGEQCGDGVVQPPEQCDDGDAIDDDDCTGLCRPPVCGDGLLRAGEACDAGPGNSDNGACTHACALATCGDGLIGPGELCDDGNAVYMDENSHYGSNSLIYVS